MAPLDSRYTQVSFNLVSVQVWTPLELRTKKACTSSKYLNRGKVERNLSVTGIQGRHEKALFETIGTSPRLICL